MRPRKRNFRPSRKDEDKVLDLTAVKTFLVYHVVTPCALVNGYQRFRVEFRRRSRLFCARTLVAAYKITRRQDPEDQIQQEVVNGCKSSFSV
jgi:hypothetical protein